MSTDGSVPTIDFACHFLPTVEDRAIHESITQTAGAPIHSDPDAALDVYRKTGVDGMVLSAPPHIGSENTEAVAHSNDALADLVATHDQLYGLAALPVAAGGDRAAREFRRCLDAGFNGGAIETDSDGVGITDPELEPVLEVADRTGAPLLVHPTLFESLAPGVYGRELGLNAIWGREVALGESICRAIHEGVLDRYPDLTLVYHHLGGNIASMLGRIELRLREEFWPGLDGAKPYPEFRRQLEDRIYVDTGGYGDDRAAIRRTLDAFPTSNVLFGTDFPYEARTAEGVESIRSAIDDVTSMTDADRVRGGNALEVLVNVD
ncbi:MAG: amidohydrolase family protein [Haloarculaceae archaeon]